MKALLFLMTLLLAVSVPVDAGKKHHRHKQDTVPNVVVVRDQMPGAWQPYIMKLVDDFNAALPKRAPRLVYKDDVVTECTHKRHGNSVTVCLAPHINLPAGGTLGTLKRGWGILYLKESTPWGTPTGIQWLLCHEFMHIATGIADDYTNPELDTSCVHGRLSSPGPFDVAYAHRVYKRRHHR